MNHYQEIFLTLTLAENNIPRFFCVIIVCTYMTFAINRALNVTSLEPVSGGDGVVMALQVIVQRSLWSCM